MNYGDLGKRVAAYFIDGIVLSVFWGIIYLMFFPIYGYRFFFDWSYYFVANMLFLFILFISSFAYNVVLEGSGWHATLGKKVMGLYVANANGNGISYSKAMLRCIGKCFSGMFFGIGYIMGLFSDKKQCLHDLIADSYVLEAGGAVAYGGARHGTYNNVNGPKIVCTSGPLAGRCYPVTDRGVVIGRDSISCQIVLPSSQASVSRVHCFVSYNSVSGMYILSDRNSSQGTFLSDGRRIPYSQPVALSSGDSFYLASPQNTFRVG